eukprot:m51a1_g8632 hypothetical protein (530) ;mRNA; f:115895-118580
MPSPAAPASEPFEVVEVGEFTMVRRAELEAFVLKHYGASSGRLCARVELLHGVSLEIPPPHVDLLKYHHFDFFPTYVEGEITCTGVSDHSRRKIRHEANTLGNVWGRVERINQKTLRITALALCMTHIVAFGSKLKSMTSDFADVVGMHQETKTFAGEASMVPVCAVMAKAKQFDDGLLAAVELLVHKGRLSKAPDIWRRCDDLGGQALGFYMWSEELRQVYAQDRFLQQQLQGLGSMLLSQSDVDQLRGLVSSDDALHSATTKHEELRRRLCNGFSFPGILAPEPECWYLPCVSPEILLIERIKKDWGVLPEGFDLASEVARRVREGSLSLAPKGDLSGWYSQCLWALEPLLKPDQTPEARKLRMKSRYCEGLETLTSLLLRAPVLLRGAGVLPKLEVYAHLLVGPLAECFLRCARLYEFVRSVLEDCFQPEELTGIRRLRADGGAARGTKEDEEAVRDWLRRFKDDSDVAEDARMMVPLFYDDDKGMWNPFPVFAEVYTKQLLDRAQFRNLCDSHKSASRIKKALLE